MPRPLFDRDAIEAGASHLFPEPGALEAVIDHAVRWFKLYLGSSAPEPV